MFSRALAYASIVPALVGGSVPVRADVLTVTASGTVGSSCSIGKPGDGDFAAPDLSAAAPVTGKATITCNVGFSLKATSANGALTNVKPAPTNFTNSIAYTLGLSVKLDDNSTVTATTPGTCTSTALQLAAGCVLTSGGKTATGTNGAGQTATMTLGYSLPTLPTRLVAGTYTDTITLTIAPSS